MLCGGINKHFSTYFFEACQATQDDQTAFQSAEEETCTFILFEFLKVMFEVGCMGTQVDRKIIILPPLGM